MVDAIADKAIEIAFYDKNDKIVAEKLFNEHKYVHEGYKKEKLSQELGLFKDFCICKQFQKESIAHKKEAFGEKIWNAYEDKLMVLMGEKAYNDYVQRAEKRKDAYLKIFDTNKNFLQKAPYVILGLAYNETPCYLTKDFNIHGIPLPGFEVYVGLQQYLSGTLIAITKFCRDMLA